MEALGYPGTQLHLGQHIADITCLHDPQTAGVVIRLIHIAQHITILLVSLTGGWSKERFSRHGAVTQVKTLHLAREQIVFQNTADGFVTVTTGTDDNRAKAISVAVVTPGEAAVDLAPPNLRNSLRFIRWAPY